MLVERERRADELGQAALPGGARWGCAPRHGREREVGLLVRAVVLVCGGLRCCYSDETRIVAAGILTGSTGSGSQPGTASKRVILYTDIASTHAAMAA